jgi:hypothetical protein
MVIGQRHRKLKQHDDILLNVYLPLRSVNRRISALIYRGQGNPDGTYLKIWICRQAGKASPG